MFKNYVTFSLRTIRRHGGYSLMEEDPRSVLKEQNSVVITSDKPCRLFEI